MGLIIAESTAITSVTKRSNFISFYKVQTSLGLMAAQVIVCLAACKCVSRACEDRLRVHSVVLNLRDQK
jgi:hypothetical protein